MFIGLYVFFCSDFSKELYIEVLFVENSLETN